MAARTLHAFDYLAAPQKHPPRAVCVVFGDEPFLRRQAVLEIRRAVLGGDDGGVVEGMFRASNNGLGRMAGWRKLCCGKDLRQRRVACRDDAERRLGMFG